MELEKVDPRTKRTRQLIKDAFISLLRKKDFNEITVKDIANKATVNRATFYAHFADKFELLDRTIVHAFRENMRTQIVCHAVLSLSTISHIIIVLCECHKELNNTYRRSYSTLGPIIQSRVIEELRNVLLHLMEKGVPPTGTDAEGMAMRETAANVLSWSIYGVTYTWNCKERTESPEALADRVVPYLMYGLEKNTHAVI